MMRITIATLRCTLVLLVTLTAGAVLAQAKFPNAPVRMLVGTPAGGTTDVIARLIAAKMSQSLAQSVVVENRTGASGLIAAESVAKAPPDGYTVLMASSQLATYRALYATTKLDPEQDLEPLGIVAVSPYVMVVHPSLPVRTLPELFAYAKANPGKISYAGSSPGTAQHLGWELIKNKVGLDMQYVPYKGTGALMPDLLAGRLQAGIDNVAILTPYIKSGQLRGIAVTSAARTSLLPDLPTVAASGVPDFQAMGWFGVFSTGRTPPEVLTALRSAVRSAVEAPEVREKLVGMGAEPQSGDAIALRSLLKRESTVWTKVIKDNNISVQ
ncbi:Bug family tripartite tricarboxylate transporter substrate binding protein [Cupriavidus basilensis]|uniref:Bug family tripartite tricarboxylate transporter substrate binding protein n=1 Tax=Cupriavidus basilensis TaxID=68895 RepID=UPI0023E83068|nr:tripartite tricarboxylate transporter substrate binding protein [Cupriavidus basilensis]MDF3888508.1 tripartite tricarboxylate transporter substrate binding protein [Cupriavidus basilensis]